MFSKIKQHIANIVLTYKLTKIMPQLMYCMMVHIVTQTSYKRNHHTLTLSPTSTTTYIHRNGSMHR